MRPAEIDKILNRPPSDNVVDFGKAKS